MIEIYCDGSCLANGNKSAIAGWGNIVVHNNKKIHEQCGKVPGLQNNLRAELVAIAHALSFIKEYHEEFDDSYMLYTDNEVVYQGIVGISVRKANRDIWEVVENDFKYLHEHNIEVDAKQLPRNSNQFHADADKIARVAANSLLI